MKTDLCKNNKKIEYQEFDNVNASYRRKKILCILVMVITLLLYISLGCFFVNKYYMIPHEIEINQNSSICTAIEIEYTPYKNYIINGTLYNEYVITHAYDEKNRNIAKLFKEYVCSTSCPKVLSSACWTYKNYVARHKYDVKKMFEPASYVIWFATGACLYPMLICYLCINYF